MQSESAQRIRRKDAKTRLQTASRDPDEDTTPQTQSLSSSVESTKEPDSEKLSIEQDIVQAYHRLESAKSKQADANEIVKQCRKEIDRLIRKIVAYHQPLPLFDKSERTAPSGGNDTDFRGMSLSELNVERIRRLDEKYGILGENAEIDQEDDSNNEDSVDVNMAEYRKSLKKTKSKRPKR